MQSAGSGKVPVLLQLHRVTDGAGAQEDAEYLIELLFDIRTL